MSFKEFAAKESSAKREAQAADRSAGKPGDASTAGQPTPQPEKIQDEVEPASKA